VPLRLYSALHHLQDLLVHGLIVGPDTPERPPSTPPQSRPSTRTRAKVRRPSDGTSAIHVVAASACGAVQRAGAQSGIPARDSRYHHVDGAGGEHGERGGVHVVEGLGRRGRHRRGVRSLRRQAPHPSWEGARKVTHHSHRHVRPVISMACFTSVHASERRHIVTEQGVGKHAV
jgi:hypothetical protein